MSTPSPQRQRILDAAVAILATKGQGGLTVRAVAEASGYSTTGIYTWFGSKDGLLEAIFTDGYLRFREHLTAADTITDPRERMHRAGELYWEWAVANPTHYMLMFVPGSFAPSENSGIATRPAYEDLLERSRPFGDETVAHHIWATMHGYAMLQIAGPPVATEFGREQLQQGLGRLLDQLAPRPS